MAQIAHLLAKVRGCELVQGSTWEVRFSFHSAYISLKTPSNSLYRKPSSYLHGQTVKEHKTTYRDKPTKTAKCKRYTAIHSGIKKTKAIPPTHIYTSILWLMKTRCLPFWHTCGIGQRSEYPLPLCLGVCQTSGQKIGNNVPYLKTR